MKDEFLGHPLGLVVEGVGEGRGASELLARANEYLDFGVDVVWLVDPVKENMTIARRDRPAQQLAALDRLTDPAVLPGFECGVSEFFDD